MLRSLLSGLILHAFSRQGVDSEYVLKVSIGKANQRGGASMIQTALIR